MTFKKLMTAFGMSLALLAGLALSIGLNTEPAAARPMQQLDYSACAHYDDFPPSNDPNRQGGRKSECKALIDLYNATNGANWTNNGSRGGGWGQGSYCFWNGVYPCRGGFVPPGNLPWSAYSQIIEIRLKDNNLVSNNSLPNGLGLPQSMGDIVGLTGLQLQGNKQLSGTLPIELTKLTNLERFWYYDTGLCPPKDDPTTTNKNEAMDFENWLATIPDARPNENCGDYELIGLEVTQAIQNWENSVPLVENKVTYVRAHVQRRAGAGDLKNVTARLIVRKNGQRLAPPLFPRNKRLYITIKENPDRAKLEENFYFKIPDAWLQGTIEIEFEAVNGQTVDCKEPAETGGKPDDCKVKVTFDPMPPLKITPYLISWTYQNIKVPKPTNNNLKKALKEIRAQLPIPTLFIKPPRIMTATFTGQIVNNEDDISRLVDKLWRRRLNDGINNHVYFGIMSDAVPQTYPLKLSNISMGAASLALYDAQALDDAVHEIGHALRYSGDPNNPNYINNHTNCHRSPGNGYPQENYIDPSYPYNNGYISEPVDPKKANTFYGFHIYTGKIYGPTTCDILGYDSNTWVSDYNYKKFAGGIQNLSTLGVQSQFAALAAQDALLISGVINDITNAGQINTIVNIQTQSTLDSSTSGAYSLRFEDSGGNVLVTYDFTPLTLSDSDARPFSLLLPRDPNTHRIVLLHNGVELDSRTASANPPTVTVTSPNGGETLSGSSATLTWTANDLDGDSLEYVIQYSPDNGATWETIHPDWPSTSYDLDPNFIPGSDQALIRVLATDGFHTSQDQSDAPFSVIKKAPLVMLFDPVPGQVFYEGQTIIAEGNAVDYEDGQIPAANLTWSSNLDGNLGTGESLSVEATLLRAGVHTITLTAQDSDGMSGADSVSITVEKPKTVTYTVNTTSDVIDANVGDGVCDSDAVTAGEQCSLRAAIQEANAANNHSLITMQPGIYYLTLDGGNTEDQAADGDLDIALNPDMRLTITGPDPNQAIIDARYTSGRVFQMLGSTVVISGVTIQRGTAASDSGYDYVYCCGGGIMLRERNGIDSDVTLVNTKLANNSSTNRGGGGAVYYIAGKLTVLNSEISGNASAGNGGGIYAIPHSGGDIDLTIIDSIFSNNSTGCTPFGCGGSGGGLYFHSGDLVISSTTFTANTATGSGGGVFHGSGDLRISGSIFSQNSADGQGGGMQVGSRTYGTVVVEDTLITHNTAAGSGGGIYGDPLVLNSTVSYNQGQDGGGMRGNPTLINSQVLSNTAVGGGGSSNSGGGGGIYSAGQLELIDSIVSYNSAATDGGGIIGTMLLRSSTVSHNNAGNSGGGITGAFTVINSAIHHNSAAQRGGGLYILPLSYPTIKVVNSTISSNSAGIGGGFDDSGGLSSSGRFSYVGVFSNTTVSNNTATSQSGGINHEQGTLTLENTLLANNSGGDCGGDSYRFYSNGHNLASDATCATLTQTGDLTGTNPQLGPLQDNGGTTLTHAIPQGSPAEDGGNNASCPTTDQRGYTRYNGNGCDIGAYEYMPQGAVLWVNPYSLTFQIPANSTAPISHTIGIGNPEELTANWTANESIPWLNLSSTSGQMPAALDVIIDSTGLTEGVYTGAITVASANLQGSPQTVGIELIVGESNSNPPGGGSIVYLPVVIK